MKAIVAAQNVQFMQAIETAQAILDLYRESLPPPSGEDTAKTFHDLDTSGAA